MTCAKRPHRHDPRPGHFRARLLLLPALALLLGALGLFAAAPAQAATPAGTVWSATLNVKKIWDGAGLGCNSTYPSLARQCSTATTLSSDSFSVGGANYLIMTIGLIDGTLVIAFQGEPNAALKSLAFCVGNRAFSLSGLTAGNISLARLRPDPALSWSVGDTVSLSIGVSCSQQAEPNWIDDSAGNTGGGNTGNTNTNTGGGGGGGGGTSVPSGDAALSALSVLGNDKSVAPLDPAFDPDTTDYTSAVPHAVSAVRLMPTSRDRDATVSVNGQPLARGGSRLHSPVRGPQRHRGGDDR